MAQSRMLSLPLSTRATTTRNFINLLSVVARQSNRVQARRNFVNALPAITQQCNHIACRNNDETFNRFRCGATMSMIDHGMIIPRRVGYSPAHVRHFSHELHQHNNSSNDDRKNKDSFTSEKSGEDLVRELTDSAGDVVHFLTPERVRTSPPSSSSCSSSPSETTAVASSSTSSPESTTQHEEQQHGDATYAMPHPVWSAEELNNVRMTHRVPETFSDRLAFLGVRGLRFLFDTVSGYSFGHTDERTWLDRIVFLETIAGVPGMVGAMVRHLHSLRSMKRDYGWIHTLLEEAENERMHLMTAMALKRPTVLFRTLVLLSQGIFLTGFLSSYIVSRRFAHRFVGYLEEEAVRTYSHLIEEIYRGNLPLFESLPAHPMARYYWGLPPESNFRDIVLAIRADESHHREVNHTFAGMEYDAPNPFPPGH